MAVAIMSSDYLQAYQNLIAMPTEELDQYDIAHMNLLCAQGLPGAQDMHIPKYLRRLDAMVKRCREKTEAALPRFRVDPNSFGVPPHCTEAMFRVGYLNQVLRQDFGLHYNPQRVSDDEKFSFLGYQDSKDLLINGLLSDQRTGTCNTIPVLAVAVGRRLGYPLKLVATRQHVWFRWESPDGKERFNAEICTPAGLDFPDDEYYKTGSPYPMSPVEIASGYYLRSFTAADELAMFLFSRAWVLDSNLRFQEALDAWAKCCFLAPAEPMYPRQAYESVLDALQMRKSGKKHPRGRDRTLKDDVSYANILDYLSPKEAAMAQSIKGHFHQVRQESGNAILAYTEACRLDPDHSDYPADLVRYNCRLQEIEKQAQVKVEVWQKDNAIAPNGNLPTPKAPVPTVAAHELHQPVSIIKPKPDIAAGALNIRAMVWAEEGLKLERKGKLAAAQAAFACGITQTVSDEPLCHVYLHRVVRKEVQASQAPAPFTSLLGKNLENPEDLDPRLKLSPVMQGVIWAERGKVFEIMGRSDEAAHAYMQASILDPKRMATSDVHRTSQKVVNQQWQQKQANTRAQNFNPLPFIPLLTIAAMPAATSHLIFTFPPVTNLEPTTFYPRSK